MLKCIVERMEALDVLILSWRIPPPQEVIELPFESSTIWLKLCRVYDFTIFTLYVSTGHYNMHHVNVDAEQTG